MQPSPPPADRPNANEDAPVLQREPLAAGTHRRDVELRPLLNVLSLVLAVVVVVVAAGVALDRLRSQSPTRRAGPLVPTIPPATSPLPPMTPVPSLPAGQGWQRAGPSWAQGIAFAPNAPRTAYVCGTPTNNDPRRQAPVALGVSHDAGHTWLTRDSGLVASACQVDVDPTNSQDLLLHLLTCLPCSPLLPAQLARSADGGQSWLRTPLPPLPGGGSAPASFVAVQWAWQSSALFVMPFFAGTQARRLLAISVAAGPFAWVNESALLAGVPADMQLNDVYATTVAVFADFDYYAPSSCVQDCLLTKVSTDLGATWSIFQPRDHGDTVFLLDQGVSIADGRTLIGQLFTNGNETRTYVQSSDGGGTWTPLPSPPGNLVIGMLASTPGGIIYAELVSFGGPATATEGVYRLAPGTASWTLVGALPDSGRALIVSWDELGNPLALWSGAGNASDQATTAGLAAHAP
jgi:hypothetical protein